MTREETFGIFKGIDITLLRYRFVLENTGMRRIGSPDKPIRAVLKHESDLFYEVALKLGYSNASTNVIPAGEMRAIEISYGLGVADISEVSGLLPLLQPEVLDEIETTAWDATLIIFEWPRLVDWDPTELMRDGSLPQGVKELMRFDLRAYK